MSWLAFDPNIPSTHGIELGRIHILDEADDHPAREANLWDFFWGGGQDVYLGTHALFLDSHALYVVAWTPEHERSREYEQNGVAMRDRPLCYWLDYVRSLAGTSTPVVVAQTQCDRERDVTEPVAQTKHGFARLQRASCSAKRADGMEGFVHDSNARLVISWRNFTESSGH
jgi:internalin A